MKTLNSLEMAKLSPASFAMYASQGRWKLAKHLSLINRKLMKAAKGGARLIINVAPRHGKCLDEHSYIQMADGTLKYIADVQVGEKVLSLDNTYRFVEDTIISKIHSGKKLIYNIDLQNSTYLHATPEHKVLTFEGWKQVKELTTEDYLYCPVKLPSGSNTISEEDIILVAIWLAEGTKNALSYQVTNESIEIQNKLKEICVNRNWNYHTKDNLHHTLSKNWETSGDTPNNVLLKYKVRGMQTDSICIPDEFLKLDNKQLALFLNYLWACDGTVTKRTLEYDSSSERIIRDLQVLLLRFRIRSKVISRMAKCGDKYFPSWRIIISDKQSMLNFAEHISIVNKQDRLNLLVEHVKTLGKSNLKYGTFPPTWINRLKKHYTYYRYHYGINLKTGTTHRDKVKRVAEIDNNTDLYNQAVGDIEWIKVKSIEEGMEVDTYDIETEKYHNFLANNIVVHNSEMISKYYPAWFLGTFPDKRVILTAYEADFAAQWGRQARDLMEEFGKELWGLEIDPDVKAASRWKIKDHLGTMYSIGAGGALMGKGSDLIIIDDPISNNEEASSPTFRRKLQEWYASTLYTRLEPGGSIVIIHQRFHYEDLTGFLLDQMQKGGEKWEWISLPAIALEDEFIESQGGFWPDILGGRKKGEALWPERWPVEKLLDIKNSGGMSSYFWASLYDQNPSPAEGGMFKEPWFKYAQYKNGYYYLQKNRDADNVELFDEKDCWKFITADVANKAGKINDYSVIAVWTVTPKNDIILQHIERDHFGYEQVLKKLIFLNGQFKPRFVGIENTGIAIQMIVEARNKGLAVRALEPEGQGKQNRANSPLGAVVRMESGKIYFLKGIQHLSDFEQELLYFPMGRNDDCVDCLSYACNELTKVSGMMSGNFVPYSVNDVITRSGSMKNLWQFGDSGYNF